MADAIDTLLSRMTLVEKVGQLNHLAATADSTGARDPTSDIEGRIRRGEVGSIAGALEIGQLRKLQTIAVEESPNGIPLIFSMDVIHGHQTIFPIPLGLACTWDPQMISRTARVAATEAAAAGITLAWAPMLDVSRDARWGRCAESPGEDPVLGSAFAKAMVEAYQQDTMAHPGSVMATAKHFAGYGFAEGGRDYNDVDISSHRMHNVVLPPFKAAIKAGVGAIMVGFHDLAGIPCTAHPELLCGLLRKQLGFDGLIVSDYTAIMELIHHGVARDSKEAALLAFTAGVDIDLMSEYYMRHVPELVGEQRIAEADVEAACRRVLRAKQQLGLFANPYRGLDPSHRDKVTLTTAARRLAREAAAKSCVLLKNNGTLPLAKASAVALIGPLADSQTNMQGTWAVAAHSADSVTLLEGMRRIAGDERIFYAKGTNLVDDQNVAARLNVFAETFALDPRSPDEMITEAMTAARSADVVVACVGEAREHTGESSTRTELGLPGSQPRLLRALRQTGKPLVLVTMSGRPLTLEWEDANADAIVHAWFGGTEAGNAIADILFGIANPSGKLTMSFPRSIGQCPIHYAELPTGRPIEMIGIDVRGDAEIANGRHVFRKFTTACRLEGPHTPLYPFGHGLSYSTFAYGELLLDKTVLNGEDDVLRAVIEVRNTGLVAGEEVVQLYIGDPVASRSRPVRELKCFKKISLQAGQSQRVNFTITVNELRFVRAERLSEFESVWEPGAFTIEIGPSSACLSRAYFEWHDKE